MTVGIGHSVLQDDAFQYGVSSSLTVPSAPCAAAQRWPRGLWHHLVNDAAHCASRILLSGDESHESVQVLDSLTMDLALSLASNQPCRCRRRHGTGQIDNALATEHEPTTRVECDGCVAVVIIMPYCTDTSVEEEIFPLLCHFAVVDSVTNDTNPTDDSLEPKNTMLPGAADSGIAGNRCHHTAAQLLNLRRIQIRRVTGLMDVWHYLLALPGLPAEQHPVGGILLHGLNRILASSSSTATAPQPVPPPPMDAAVSTIRQTQLGAYGPRSTQRVRFGLY
jgi:hypothetical protein